jgi:D-alanyl-D-alanine carboxypeptidase
MRIFRAVLAHPELRAICRMKEYRLTTAAKTQILRNHNRLLGYYPGMDAAKTGWTVASRHTYAASVIRGKHELLLTLLDSPNKWADAQILFNYGLAEDAPTTAEALPAGDADAGAPAGRATP